MTTEIGAAGDLVVGAQAIALAIGMKPRAVYHLASKGALPGALRIGGQLALSLTAYRVGLAAKIAAAALPIAA